jgi:hypothetical protein
MVRPGHQQPVHVGRRGHDGLGARDHDAVAAPLHHVHVGVGVRLLGGAQGSVPFGIGHRDGVGEIVVLHLVHERDEARVIVGARIRVDTVGCLVGRVEAVHHQVTHRTPRLLAHQSRVLELREQVRRRLVDVQETVDRLAAGGLGGPRHRLVAGLQSVVVGDADGGDAGRQLRVVGDALHRPAADEHPRLQGPQRFAKIGRSHEHRKLSPVPRPASVAFDGDASAV